MGQRLTVLPFCRLKEETESQALTQVRAAFAVNGQPEIFRIIAPHARQKEKVTSTWIDARTYRTGFDFAG